MAGDGRIVEEIFRRPYLLTTLHCHHIMAPNTTTMRKWMRMSTSRRRSLPNIAEEEEKEEKMITIPRPRRVSLDMSDLSISFRDSLGVQPDPHFDQLARKLDDKFHRDSKQIRQRNRRASINKAREDYLECLGALQQSATSTSSLSSSSNSPSTAKRTSSLSSSYNSTTTAKTSSSLSSSESSDLDEELAYWKEKAVTFEERA